MWYVIWVACCVHDNERKKEWEFTTVRGSVKEREREKERGRVCICDVYIVLRKKERELFQGTPCYYLPPIIPNNNSMFKMQHQKKKGNYRYHEIKYSVRKHEDVSLFRTFLVLRKGERHLESYLFVDQISFWLLIRDLRCNAWKSIEKVDDPREKKK